MPPRDPPNVPRSATGRQTQTRSRGRTRQRVTPGPSKRREEGTRPTPRLEVFEYRIEGTPEVTLEGGDLSSDGEDMTVKPPKTPPAWRELSIQTIALQESFRSEADQGVQATISVTDSDLRDRTGHPSPKD
ncbi:hypothetical protein ARMSODRAFT_66515 [Armillaria solidipes]|uniref:Uncharacterized protein n=1 Tax=Armillaria solidipes TaxID=1076256 RepID=A0A2H3BW32_9AGAR|nr:hypothetical protein ARMSODRAFT_66515 [Armillaria solidipes]